MGVNAVITAFIPAVTTDDVVISNFQNYYRIRLVNSRRMSLATLIVLALA
jgi:hypothetical protein